MERQRKKVMEHIDKYMMEDTESGTDRERKRQREEGTKRGRYRGRKRQREEETASGREKKEKEIK